MPVTPSRPPLAATPSPIEHHYSVAEIAELLNVSGGTVRNLFFDEPGVLQIGKASRLMGGRAKKLIRHYIVLRIPESVLLRVRDRLVHKRPAESATVPAARIRNGASDVHAAS